MIKKCLVCDMEYRSKPSARRKYCSRKCSDSIPVPRERVERQRLAKIGRVPWNKGLNKDSNDFMRKVSTNRKGKLMGDANPSKRPEVRERISRILKEKYAKGELTSGFTSEYGKKRIREMLARYPKISKAEIKVQNWLDEHEIPYIAQWSYELGIADFFIPDLNLVVECHGTYWHSLPNYAARDFLKKEWLLNNGFELLVLNSEEVMKTDLEPILSEVVLI